MLPRPWMDSSEDVTITTVCFLLCIDRNWVKWRVHVWQKQTVLTAGQSSDVTRCQQLPNSWRAGVQHAGINDLSRKRPSSGQFQRQSELRCLQHHRDTNSSSRTNIQLLLSEKETKHQRKENQTSQNVWTAAQIQNIHRYVVIMSLLRVMRRFSSEADHYFHYQSIYLWILTSRFPKVSDNTQKYFIFTANSHLRGRNQKISEIFAWKII